eukprot:1763884-Prymnesium_polylepis.3
MSILHKCSLYVWVVPRAAACTDVVSMCMPRPTEAKRTRGVKRLTSLGDDSGARARVWLMHAHCAEAASDRISKAF